MRTRQSHTCSTAYLAHSLIRIGLNSSVRAVSLDQESSLNSTWAGSNINHAKKD